jgi:hypothetical protein
MVAAILARNVAEHHHAAILAIVAKVAINLVVGKQSVAPNTLVRCEYFVNNRHDYTLYADFFLLVDSFLNRRNRNAATYRIPVVVYSASILHNTKSPFPPKPASSPYKSITMKV